MVKTENTPKVPIDFWENDNEPIQGNAATPSSAQKGQKTPRGPNLKLNTEQQAELISICVRNRRGFVPGGVFSFWEKVTQELSKRHGKQYKSFAIKRIGTALGSDKAKELPEVGDPNDEWRQMRELWAETMLQFPRTSGRYGGNSTHEENDASSPPRERTALGYPSSAGVKRSASPEPLPHEGKKRARGMKQQIHDVSKANTNLEEVTPGPDDNADAIKEIKAHLQLLQAQMATLLTQQKEILKELRAR